MTVLASPGRRPAACLALVAACYAVAQLVLVDPRMPLSFDEAVYASQFSIRVPRMDYAAHRSIGEALLAAPLVSVTTSVIATRCYFAVLSGGLLFLAFWPWLRVRGGAVVPLAAALFAVNWVALFYGAAVLPNVPVALAAVAATGLFLRAVTARESRRPVVALFAIVLALTLLRPSDAVWIGAPLVAAGLLVPSWRRAAAPLAVAVGMAAGWAEWAIEAYARFGDPLTRLAHVNEVSGGDGPYFLLARQLQATGGRVACAPYEAVCGPYRPAAIVFWCGGLLLVALGVWAVRWAPWRGAVLLAVAQAAAIGVPYLVLIDWAVPRYLLPAYALLSLPAAEGLAWLARRPLPAPLLVGGAAVGLLTHAVLQADTLSRMNDGTFHTRHHDVAIVHGLAERKVTQPCVVLGSYAPEVAYLGRCRAYDMPDGIEPRSSAGDVRPDTIRAALAGGARVVLLVAGDASPPADGAWDAFRVRGDRRRVFVSPGQDGPR